MSPARKKPESFWSAHARKSFVIAGVLAVIQAPLGVAAVEKTLGAFQRLNTLELEFATIRERLDHNESETAIRRGQRDRMDDEQNRRLGALEHLGR